MPDKRPARKNTRLGGHGLVGGGTPNWRRNGCAVCECGALSEPGISQAEARRWMNVHKDEIRAKRAGRADGIRVWTFEPEVEIANQGGGLEEDLRFVAAFRDWLAGDHVGMFGTGDAFMGTPTIMRDGKAHLAFDDPRLNKLWRGKLGPGHPGYEDMARVDKVRTQLRSHGLPETTLRYCTLWNSAAAAGYHGPQHLYTVAINAMDGAKTEDVPLEDRTPLLLAALFHDIDHTLTLGADQVNIDRAIAAFDNAAITVLRDVDEATAARARELIQATCTPHQEPASAAAAVLMDADLMQVMEPDRERWVAGLRSEGYVETEEQAIQFVRTSRFETEWGRRRQQEFLTAVS